MAFPVVERSTGLLLLEGFPKLPVLKAFGPLVFGGLWNASGAKDFRIESNAVAGVCGSTWQMKKEYARTVEDGICRRPRMTATRIAAVKVWMENAIAARDGGAAVRPREIRI